MMVCIEGIDAAGKASQSRRLAHRMKAELFTFPDYTTRIGHMIKGHLSGYWTAAPRGPVDDPNPERVKTLDAVVFQALQLANRMEHAATIAGLQVDGRNVVLDRYWPSGFVYGTADGLDGDWLISLHQWLPQPDLFLLLDVDPAVSTQRRPERRDRYEKQEGLMTRAVGLYRDLWTVNRAKSQPFGTRWVVVDGNETEDEVAADIWRIVSDPAVLE